MKKFAEKGYHVFGVRPRFFDKGYKGSSGRTPDSSKLNVPKESTVRIPDSYSIKYDACRIIDIVKNHVDNLKNLSEIDGGVEYHFVGNSYGCTYASVAAHYADQELGITPKSVTLNVPFRRYYDACTHKSKMANFIGKTCKKAFKDFNDNCNIPQCEYLTKKGINLTITQAKTDEFVDQQPRELVNRLQKLQNSDQNQDPDKPTTLLYEFGDGSNHLNIHEYDEYYDLSR